MRPKKDKQQSASCDEFELIERFFHKAQHGKTIDLSIGDDCALLGVKDTEQLAQSLDTLVAGVHFPTDIDPYLLGRRALATALSDLAAMGAKPHSFLLALTLPEVNTSWLQKLSKGLMELASFWSIPLIGGDTTRGPLTLSLLVQGTLSKGRALRRDQARAEDLVCVSGTVGDAGAALAILKNPVSAVGLNPEQKSYLLKRYYEPDIRITLGLQLVAVGCRCCIDISDGLLADLGHILSASKVGAQLNLEAVPRSEAGRRQGQSLFQALAAGDDYELCFCMPDTSWHALQKMPHKVPLTVIGKVVAEQGFWDGTGAPIELPVTGYHHF